MATTAVRESYHRCQRLSESLQAIEILRSNGLPLQQTIAGFRTAEIAGRRSPRPTRLGVAFDVLALNAEYEDVTILEYLDVLEVR